MQTEEALDLVASRKQAGDLKPAHLPLAGARGTALKILLILDDPCLRPEHRARIYEDLVLNRDLILRRDDPRLVDLIFWGEHVDSLYSSLRKGRLETFHYVRALEATCRRCDFDLLPVLGKMDELGRAWSRRDYQGVLQLFLPDVVELEPAGETPKELSL